MEGLSSGYGLTNNQLYIQPFHFFIGVLMDRETILQLLEKAVSKHLMFADYYEDGDFWVYPPMECQGPAYIVRWKGDVLEFYCQFSNELLWRVPIDELENWETPPPTKSCWETWKKHIGVKYGMG